METCISEFSITDIFYSQDVPKNLCEHYSGPKATKLPEPEPFDPQIESQMQLMAKYDSIS